MEFSIEFYETANGNCPVRDFLDDLKETDPGDFAAVIAGLAKLKDRKNHREPLSKSIGQELFELRHVGKLNTRILWFFCVGQKIIVVHGIRNKSREIPARDIGTAIERLKEWKRRNKK